MEGYSNSMRKNKSSNSLISRSTNLNHLAQKSILSSSPSCPSLAIFLNNKEDELEESSRPRSNSLQWAFDHGDKETAKLSDVKEALFTLRKSGVMKKRGFRFFKRWVDRRFLLAGRNLFYYKLNNYFSQMTKIQDIDLYSEMKPRGCLELNENTKVFIDYEKGVDGIVNVLNIIPNSSKKHIWYMTSNNLNELKEWEEAIQAAIRLVCRCEKKPTLRGMGSLLDHFTVGEKLGEGKFGVVRKATSRLTGDIFAVKSINKKKVKSTTLQNEINILRILKEKCSHTNVLRFYEIYDDDFLLQIVMEYVNSGDLFDRITQCGKYSEEKASQIIQQAASALQCIHDLHIIHRDIKPDNFLIQCTTNDKGEIQEDIKIADFGCSLHLPDSRSNAIYQCDGKIVGTPGYMSPELLELGITSKKSDIFSLGVILYILLCGYPPFYGNSAWEVNNSCVECKPSFEHKEWSVISEEAKDLVKRMLTKDVKKRISLADILAHPWINNPSKTNLVETHTRINKMVNMIKEKKTVSTPELKASSVIKEKDKVDDHCLTSSFFSIEDIDILRNENNIKSNLLSPCV